MVVSSTIAHEIQETLRWTHEPQTMATIHAHACLCLSWLSCASCSICCFYLFFVVLQCCHIYNVFFFSCVLSVCMFPLVHWSLRATTLFTVILFLLEFQETKVKTDTRASLEEKQVVKHLLFHIRIFFKSNILVMLMFYFHSCSFFLNTLSCIYGFMLQPIRLRYKLRDLTCFNCTYANIANCVYFCTLYFPHYDFKTELWKKS